MNKYIQPYMIEAFKDHELTELDAGNYVRYFVMKKPDSSFYSVELLFVSHQIIIFGDVRIGPIGSVIARGYKLNWFIENLDGDYLCEKFLPDRKPRRNKENWENDAGWLGIVQQKFKELYPTRMK